MQQHHPQSDRYKEGLAPFGEYLPGGKRRRIRLRLFFALLVALIGLTGFLIVLAIAVTGR